LGNAISNDGDALFPAIAIISSPFLIIFTGSYLNGSRYFAFLDYIIKIIPFSVSP
mgnify:CR=1